MPGTNVESVELIDLINFTDFVEYSSLFNLFKGDKTMKILDQLKKEKSIVSEIYNCQLNSEKIKQNQGFAQTPQN